MKIISYNDIIFRSRWTRLGERGRKTTITGDCWNSGAACAASSAGARNWPRLRARPLHSISLLLCVRGHPYPGGRTISEVADYLVLAHNTAVELVDRAQEANLLQRVRDTTDRRAVRLRLTRQGSQRLESLAMATMDELARFFPQIDRLWRDLA